MRLRERALVPHDGAPADAGHPGTDEIVRHGTALLSAEGAVTTTMPLEIAKGIRVIGIPSFPADTSTVALKSEAYPKSSPAPLPSLTSALSRRAAIFGIATVGAASVTAGATALAKGEVMTTLPSAVDPADAGPSKSISPLATALQAEFQQLAHEEKIATEKFDVADERLQYPDAPEEIFCREDDMATLRWHTWDVDWRSKRRWWGEDARIERLRIDDYAQYKSEINRRAAARRDEIVGAWDSWQSERQAARDRCGYTAARAEWVAASERYEAFRLRLVHMPTTDPDIMKLKADITIERYDGVVGLDSAIQGHLRNEDDLEALCFSLVRDFALRLGAAV